MRVFFAADAVDAGLFALRLLFESCFVVDLTFWAGGWAGGFAFDDDESAFDSVGLCEGVTVRDEQALSKVVRMDYLGSVFFLSFGCSSLHQNQYWCIFIRRSAPNVKGCR